MSSNLLNRIAIILDLKGWSQVDLAKKTKINEGQLNRIIKGANTPRIDTAFRISKALGFPIEKVFEFVPAKEAESKIVQVQAEGGSE